MIIGASSEVKTYNTKGICSAIGHGRVFSNKSCAPMAVALAALHTGVHGISNDVIAAMATTASGHWRACVPQVMTMHPLFQDALKVPETGRINPVLGELLHHANQVAKLPEPLSSVDDVVRSMRAPGASTDLWNGQTTLSALAVVVERDIMCIRDGQGADFYSKTAGAFVSKTDAGATDKISTVLGHEVTFTDDGILRPCLPHLVFEKDTIVIVYKQGFYHFTVPDVTFDSFALKAEFGFDAIFEMVIEPGTLVDTTFLDVTFNVDDNDDVAEPAEV